MAAEIDAELKPAGMKLAPTWSEDLFPEGLLDTLRAQFAAGERVAARVPMTVEFKDGHREDTFFDAFLERDATLTRGEDHFVRRDMTISGISTLGGQRGIRGIVVVSDKVLSSLLGDAEGPAHEDWKEAERRPDRTYAMWKSRVRFVKQALAKLVTYLSPPPAGLNVDLLQDIFNVADASKAGPRPKSKGKKAANQVPLPQGPNPPPPTPPPPGPPKWWRVTQTAGGFRVRRNGEAPAPALPQRLRVVVAYDLPDGNAIRGWSPFDFVLDDKDDNPVKIRRAGVKVDRGEKGNCLILEVGSPDFLLEVDGFETQRGDLVIRSTEAGADAGSAAEADDAGQIDDAEAVVAAGVTP